MTRVSDLPIIDALASNDLIPVVDVSQQGTARSHSTTLSQIAAYTQSQLTDYDPDSDTITATNTSVAHTVPDWIGSLQHRAKFRLPAGTRIAALGSSSIQNDISVTDAAIPIINSGSTGIVVSARQADPRFAYTNWI